MENKELMQMENNNTDMVINTQGEAPMGFEDEDSDDMIIPRIKIVQTLSPERKEKLADEGDIINSLTKEKLNGKKFIPVFKFNSNILWKDRSEGGGIACHARDGRIGVLSMVYNLLVHNVENVNLIIQRLVKKRYQLVLNTSTSLDSLKVKECQ